MEPALDLGTVWDFAVAILIGALAGIEREKRKELDQIRTIGGLRTFILLALVGAVAAWLSQAAGTPWIFVGALIAVGATLVAGYALEVRNRPDAIGITTQVAALAVFLLGGMTVVGHRELAIGLGIVTAAVLAYKQPLHGLVERIGWDDIFAGLRLLIATFIVLPLLPDRPVDPLGALNPYTLWLLVILISSLSLIGYVATRLMGDGRGLALTGLTGGLVSSTAVTLSFARRGRERKGAGTLDLLACGLVIAWGVMFGRVVVEVLVVNPAMVERVLVPFAAMGAAAGALAWYFWRGNAPPRGSAEEVPLKNPFSLSEAAKFALFFAVVLLAVKLVEGRFPNQGLYVVAGLAGLTDVDAITLSLAQYAGDGGNETIAVRAIFIASFSNTLVKCGMAAILGGKLLGRRMLVATAVVLAIGTVAMFFI